jgi:hypothetical protein
MILIDTGSLVLVVAKPLNERRGQVVGFLRSSDVAVMGENPALPTRKWGRNGVGHNF